MNGQMDGWTNGKAERQRQKNDKQADKYRETDRHVNHKWAQADRQTEEQMIDMVTKDIQIDRQTNEID